MNSTLALIEAGPAAGSLAFAVGNGTGAGLAADGTIASRREGIHGKVVLLDVILHLVASPCGHGIQFNNVEIAQDIEVVELNDAGFFTSLILLSTNASDPNIQFGEFFLEGNDLTK